MDWRDYNPANADNAQDGFGLNHNLMLEYFTENFKSITPKTFTSSAINILLPKAFELLGLDPDLALKQKAYAGAAFGAIAIDDPYKVYFNLRLFTDQFQSFIRQIDQIIFNLNVNNVLETIDLLKPFDTIISDSDLGRDELELALQYNAVARYSSAYWIAQLNTEDTPWIAINATYGNGQFRQDGNPPDWVYHDLLSLWTLAWETGFCLPCTLLGAAVGSAITALW